MPAARRTSSDREQKRNSDGAENEPNDIEFSGEKEGAQRLTPSPLQRGVRHTHGSRFACARHDAAEEVHRCVDGGSRPKRCHRQAVFYPAAGTALVLCLPRPDWCL